MENIIAILKEQHRELKGLLVDTKEKSAVSAPDCLAILQNLNNFNYVTN